MYKKSGMGYIGDSILGSFKCLQVSVFMRKKSLSHGGISCCVLLQATKLDLSSRFKF